MNQFRILQILKIIQGDLIFWPIGRYIDGFINQPNYPTKNCLYFPFRGIKDEDELLAKMIKSNAAGIVVKNLCRLDLNKWVKSGIGIIQVDDMEKAYLLLATFYRQKFDIPFVEVTGSCGKTVTKEMIAAILKEKYSTLVTKSNFNAPRGVAYTLNQLKSHHKAAVLEVGMKAPCIIRESTAMIQPRFGVITNVLRQHLKELGTIDNVIKAKAEMIDYIPEDGYLIINGEDEHSQKLPLKNCKGRVLTYGFSKKFDIWARDIKWDGKKTTFKACTGNIVLNCTLKTFGRFNVSNALAAILIGFLMGIKPEAIIRGLKKFVPPRSRFEFMKGKNDTLIINDTCTANPDSMGITLSELSKMSDNKPHIFVLGDMDVPKDEALAKRLHFEIGLQLAAMDFDKVITVGKWSEEYLKGIHLKDKTKFVKHFSKVEDAEEHLLDTLIPECVVFCKCDKLQFIHLIEKIKCHQK